MENKPPTPSHTHTNTHTLAEALRLQSLQQSDRHWRKPCRQGQTMQMLHTNINKSNSLWNSVKPMNRKCEAYGTSVNLPRVGPLRRPSYRVRSEVGHQDTNDYCEAFRGSDEQKKLAFHLSGNDVG